MDSLSTAQARKLVLLSQHLGCSQRLSTSTNKSKAITLSHLQHLGYVQIDTISVVQRAHHHCLWSRNSGYANEHIEQLVADGEVFEYWSHAAAYLPMCDYRHSLPRKAALASGEMDHWYPRDETQIREVLARIRAEGPLKARDFEHDKRHFKVGEWHHKPAKRALTYLFMQGDLMSVRREGFQMVYDLCERVLPTHVDIRHPSPTEHAQHLICRYLRANGIGQIKDIVYLRKGLKALITQTVAEMLEERQLIEVLVNTHTYLALPEQLQLLDKRLLKSQACILSPFDNLLIQRHRMRELFNFDYLIECYTPEAKRRYGYFSLPILWQGKFMARIDCKAERKTGKLHLRSLHAEKHLKKREDFLQALQLSLQRFSRFNQCEQLDAQHLSGCSLAASLLEQLKKPSAHKL